jgi:ribosomal protein S18 acetylase RimI-like enzyme
MIQIKQITTVGEELNTCIQLFKAYAQELNEDLCFQSFEAELQNPLKKYAPPSGALLLAYYNQEPAGCVALTDITNTTTSHSNNNEHKHAEPTCEMKRLYVQPAFRKHKIGDALVNAILTIAQEKEYRVMKLDTLEKLQPAIQLYLKHGFVITNAYYKNPLPNVVYMQKQLVL